MSYKIPYIPGSKAYKEEIADFWEVEAMRNPSTFISQININKILSKELNEINHEGIDSEDDEMNEKNSEVFEEINRRSKSMGSKYPFVINKYSIKIIDENNFFKLVYTYLLLGTRLNMQTQKKFNGVDGTLLFERVCAYVLKKYFGDNASSFVFGTAVSGAFKDKVNDLIKKIGEGTKFSNPNNHSPPQKDDAIDVVAWKEFSDKRMGKLIGFGQCKTGTTSWRDGIKKLNSEDFCAKWFTQVPVYTPLQLVFLCDTMNEDFNFYTAQFRYLIFNRFRVVEYLDENLDPQIKDDIEDWVKGALEFIDVKK